MQFIMNTFVLFSEETALVDSNITQYLIKNLKPFAVYNVTMAAEGHIGFGGQSETLQFRVKPSSKYSACKSQDGTLQCIEETDLEGLEREGVQS